jgi:hypothetical protein
MNPSGLQNSVYTRSELLPENGDAYLDQNLPNPFNKNTVISYYLESSVSKAAIYIYDMQGKQIKSINIADREYGNIMISANELQPGLYFYSLVADGTRIGTKQMVLTD